MALQLTQVQIDRIDRAVVESGLELVIASEHRPRELVVRFPGTNKQLRLLAYIWAIRPGGGGQGVRPDDERRVQLTRPRKADFETRSQWQTLLLGYEPQSDLYAAWEFKWRRFTRRPPGHPGGRSIGSPSAQTRQSILDEAALNGLAFYAHTVEVRDRHGQKRPREELVANFRPDHLSAYLSWLRPTVVSGSSTPEARTQQRRRVATERLARDATFRKKVVAAYGNACAFCGLGAKVVEAAHIRPVSDGGPDDVDNGIALCPTHHRLFDRGYILVKPTSREIEVNGKKMKGQVPAEDRERIADDLRRRSPNWPAAASAKPASKHVKRHRKLHRF